MKYIHTFLFICFALLTAHYVKAEENMTKVKLTINNTHEVIINLQNNNATAQLLQMLPAEFDFTDFAGEEKITYFPEPISLTGVKGGMVATAGKLFIYAPWKNMGIFYKTHSLRPDDSLIELGELESGLEYIRAQKGEFKGYMEIVK